MAPIHGRSHVPPRWMKVRWGWGCVVAFVLLCSGSSLGAATFPLMFVLLIAWALWRGDRDGGRN